MFLITQQLGNLGKNGLPDEDKLSALLRSDCKTVRILLTTSMRNAVRQEKRILIIILGLDLQQVDVTRFLASGASL